MDDEIKQLMLNLGGIPAAIARVEGKLSDVDDIVRSLQISVATKEATQDTLINGLSKSVNGLGKKISDHIGNHWSWLTVTIILTGTIVAVAGYLAK